MDSSRDVEALYLNEINKAYKDEAAKAVQKININANNLSFQKSKNIKKAAR